MAQRVGTALRLVRQDLGLPMILLALGGLVLAIRIGLRDRLALAIAAWGVAWLCFAGVGLLAPVSGSYERYAAEFIGRVDLAAYPAAVLLGAHAAAWLWRAHAIGRVAALALVLGVASSAFMIWRAWIH